MSLSIGIDLGTSTSEIAVFRDGKPEFLRDIRNSRAGILPSVVAQGPHGNLIVGEAADRSLETVREVKRHMGTEETFSLGGEEYRPEEISARILRHLVDNAERILGCEVPEAVITVPADFMDRERHATMEAGRIAGLRVERIVNEPTAAALAYGLHGLDEDQHILVYDLGGGTFDVSVLEMFAGILEVKASAGDKKLGGIDFDKRVVRLIEEELKRRTGIELPPEEDPAGLEARLKVRAAAERAKVELSAQDATEIDIPYLGNRETGFRMVLSRREFEVEIRDLVERTGESLDRGLRDAGLGAEEIDEVLLVGGSTRIPAVREFVSAYFDGRTLPERVPPDEAVALGAAVQAALKQGEIDPSASMVVTDVTSHSLGVAAMTYEAGMLMPDRMSVHIPRQSTLPLERTERYQTVHDGQTRVQIRVYQGESRDAEQNQLLDALDLEGIPPAPAGQEALDITFDLDVNATLTVTGTVVSTGKSAKIRIEPSDARMAVTQRETAAERLEDQWKKSRFYERVAPLLQTAERQLAKAEGSGERERIRSIVEALKRALAEEDETAVDRLDEELTDVLFALQ